MREICDIEKRLNDIEESFNTAIKDLRIVIEEKKNSNDDFDKNDFKVKNKFYIDNNVVKEIIHVYESKEMFFSTLYNYDIFSDKETAERWAKKINAQLKLRIIAEHLNEGWKPNLKDSYEKKWIISCYKNELEANYADDLCFGQTCFQTKVLAEKAIELMGDQVHDLFLEQ